jgi:hypothetical protein
VNFNSFILEDINNISDGYFVEAGAFDGIRRSNTYKLEKDWGWKGICCEPNEDCWEKLRKNRACALDFNLLYDSDGEEKVFYKASTTGGTLEDFAAEENRLYSRLINAGKKSPPTFSKEQIEFIKKTREIPQGFEDKTPTSKVKTIMLNTLLEKHKAPRNIDYFSLDTEGSELKILSAFDFSKWNIRSWTIEHNKPHRKAGDESPEKILDLMLSNGYERGRVGNGRDYFFYKY